LQDSRAPSAEATITGNLFSSILQGKIIDVVLETAINTDLPGSLRAIVSRDVYAEAGKTVLIPKGSRLIGTYDASVKRGQARVYIIWNRVIRPDGVDIAIDSPATDELGRSGIPGEVDPRYLEIFGNSVLLSTLTIAVASAAEGLTNAKGVQEGETGSGDTTRSGSVTDLTVVDTLEGFNDVVKSITSDFVTLKPRILVDQGERIKVFVNRDLIFPEDAVDGSITFIR
ncbi:MAG: TrbI/VirB10 family protein, partial [Rickettsiales bacterium]|nr:TrbI/VirB10 family protein [Rickettsiales bacterium]